MGKLGLGDARQILAMLNGDEVASSRLSHRMATLLQKEGLLFSKTNGSRCKYRIDGPLREGCRIFLAQQFGLKCSIEEFIELSSQSSSSFSMSSSFSGASSSSVFSASRAQMVEAMGDSKYHHIRTFRGFLVNSYSPMEASLNGQALLVHPMEGSMTFINAPESFEIPEDVLIVGMENAENFMLIRKQKYLFDSLYPKKEYCL